MQENLLWLLLKRWNATYMDDMGQQKWGFGYRGVDERYAPLSFIHSSSILPPPPPLLPLQFAVVRTLWFVIPSRLPSLFGPFLQDTELYHDGDPMHFPTSLEGLRLGIGRNYCCDTISVWWKTNRPERDALSLESLGTQCWRDPQKRSTYILKQGCKMHLEETNNPRRVHTTLSKSYRKFAPPIQVHVHARFMPWLQATLDSSMTLQFHLLF